MAPPTFRQERIHFGGHSASCLSYNLNSPNDSKKKHPLSFCMLDLRGTNHFISEVAAKVIWGFASQHPNLRFHSIRSPAVLEASGRVGFAEGEGSRLMIAETATAPTAPRLSRQPCIRWPRRSWKEAAFPSQGQARSRPRSRRRSLPRHVAQLLLFLTVTAPPDSAAAALKNRDGNSLDRLRQFSTILSLRLRTISRDGSLSLFWLLTVLAAGKRFHSELSCHSAKGMAWSTSKSPTSFLPVHTHSSPGRSPA